jgi:hypothetical protein
MPPRSRLFSLEMIGVGTPGQEALSSYLIRLARLHMLRPNMLVSRVVIPLTRIQAPHTVGNFTTHYAKTLNGLGKYATEFSAALNQLTMRDDLALGTCLPWKDILDPKAVGLLHPHPRWCPICFMERRLSGKEPYLPLAWFLSQIAHCTTHQKQLEDICPHCGHHQPFIPKHYYMDHCSYCHQSLAFVGEKPNPRSEMPPKSLGRFFSTAMVEMIATAPEAGAYATNDRLVHQIRRLALQMSDGNLAAMHRRLGLREKTVVGWIRDGNRPTILSFLTLCHRIGIKPINFLREDLPKDFDPGIQRYSPPKLGGKINLSKAEKTRIENFLKATLADEDSSPALKEVATHLGYTPSFLRYWWRKLCLEIAERHRIAVHERSLLRLKTLRARVAEISKEIFDVNPNAATKRIQERLAAERVCLAWPEVRRVVNETRATYLNQSPASPVIARRDQT